MAVEHQEFAIVIANSYTPTAPLVASMTMGARVVREVRIRIPPGPRGEVGFRLGSGGQAVLPSNGTGWVIGDNEVVDFTLDNVPQTGSWQLIAYNTGTYPHTIYVIFALDPVTAAGKTGGMIAGPLAPVAASIGAQSALWVDWSAYPPVSSVISAVAQRPQ